MIYTTGCDQNIRLDGIDIGLVAVAGCCEHGKELLGYIKRIQFLDLLSDCAAWSLFESLADKFVDKPSHAAASCNRACVCMLSRPL